MKPITVLSLFDGISCGQIALERANIPVNTYYASEIDKYAIQVTQKNYPNTIQLGDVTKIDFKQFEGKVDLLIGGSPCQDLSIAGNRKGLAGERSGLFYKYVEALQTIKPKYFLLENNVGMPKEAYEEISQLLGYYPVMINSALVSAQSRKRFYWTNIGEKEYDLFGFPTCAIPQPEDKHIFLQDVLINGLSYLDKSYCITANEGNGSTLEYSLKKKRRTQIAQPIIYNKYNNIYNTEKTFTLTSSPANITSKGGQVVLYQIPRGKNQGGIKKDKSPTLTSNSWEYNNFYCKPIQIGCLNESNSQANRIYSVNGKTVTLKSNGGGGGVNTGLYKVNLPNGDYIIRKLYPLECERLQTLPDNYTEGISNTQRYKCIGNGWTVDVIAHIFNFLKEELEKTIDKK